MEQQDMPISACNPQHMTCADTVAHKRAFACLSHAEHTNREMPYSFDSQITTISFHTLPVMTIRITGHYLMRRQTVRLHRINNKSLKNEKMAGFQVAFHA